MLPFPPLPSAVFFVFMVPQPAACQIVVSFTERHATLSNLHSLKFENVIISNFCTLKITSGSVCFPTNSIYQYFLSVVV